jgi:hypothetical protein
MVALKSLGWHDAVWAVAIAAVALGAYFFFRTPEPARTGLELVAQVCARPAARAEAIARHVADPLELSGAAGGELEGEHNLSHAELATRLAELDAFAPGCAFALEGWALRPGARGTVWLEGELVYSDSQPSDLHAGRRWVRALFREVGGVERLERVLLGPPERHLPEARP